jgi:hypothetical protein
MKIVIGLFERTEDAERAVNELIARGFDATQIGIFASDQSVKEHMQRVRDEGGPTEAYDQAIPRQVATGAASGSAIGGIAGLIGGVTAEFIPGIGAVVGAGAIVGATLLGAGLGAGAGAAVGGLLKLRVPEQTMHLCIQGVNCNEIVLSINVIDGLAGEVESIFRQNLAQDIATHHTDEHHLTGPSGDAQMPGSTA